MSEKQEFLVKIYKYQKVEADLGTTKEQVREHVRALHPGFLIEELEVITLESSNELRTETSKDQATELRSRV